MMYRTKEEVRRVKADVFRFVCEYCEENGWGPSYRDISDATGVSTGQVKWYLTMLEGDGFLRLGGGARMVAVTEEGRNAARKLV